MFQVLAVTIIVMSITTPACDASKYDREEYYGTYNVVATSGRTLSSHHIQKREWESLSELTAYFFIFALSCSALLFVVLVFDSFTGHNFVNSFEGNNGLSLARENYGVTLTPLTMNPDALVSIINSIR